MDTMVETVMVKLILICLLLISSCKYKLSTYSAMTPDQDLNDVFLEKIQQEEGSVGANFKIALIADTHNYYSELDDLVKKINANGPYSFVIICGDVTNLGVLEEYEHSKRFFNKLKFPYLVAVGNHDLLANGEDIFKKMFGRSDFDFIYKNIHFVFFDNNNWENAGTVPDIGRVAEILINSAAPERILIAHVPPDDKKRFSPDQIQEWENLMTTGNVTYFINGHNHNPRVDPFGVATRITIGAPSKKKYFELIVGPGGIQHQKVSF